MEWLTCKSRMFALEKDKERGIEREREREEEILYGHAVHELSSAAKEMFVLLSSVSTVLTSNLVSNAFRVVDSQL